MLGSNLSAIDFLRYAVTNFVLEGEFLIFPSIFVTDNATWLKKPNRKFAFKGFYCSLSYKNCLNNLLSVDEQVIV